ncbi:PASTA domain-containing protein [Sphaerisporangium dianthi]|uniref:PASTA domain-containing protein n=1 Tax=Sphaerisporangium dianthi TaxID=1436120 RepID=A0ABV9CJ85_9ACTN
MKLKWLRGPGRPAKRVGAALLAVVILGGVLAAAAGIGYTAARPLLNDGSAFMGKGHTAARLNGETGRSDAEVAMQLATGEERLQPVSLPGGRLAVVNEDTGKVIYLDAATLTADASADNRPASAGKIDVVSTESDGYLVDSEKDTIDKIAVPGASKGAPLTVEEGIKEAVPAADSIWVVTDTGDIIEVAGGREVRRIRLGAPPVGVTVADSQPIAVTEDGTAYVIDGDEPRAAGKLGVSGRSVFLGAWRGAGRHVLAVDPKSRRLAVLDPRTGHAFDVELDAGPRAELAAPVMLGDFAYVPDHSGPRLWKVDLRQGKAVGKPLDVPGQPGVFELKVTSGRVWANNQYDRRTLVVDAGGRHRYADKGAGPELTDTEGQNRVPEQPKAEPSTVPTRSPKADVEPSQPPADTTTPPIAATKVTVPAIERGTPYQEACATINQAGLRCRPVPASEETAGLEAGDVLDTRPAAGRPVAKGSRVEVRYVGPLLTPAVRGVPYKQACRELAAVKLKCEKGVAVGPALAPEELGVVSEQNPLADTEVARGDTITLSYPETIALPNVTDQPFAEACERLKQQYQMRCQGTVDGPPPAGKQPGLVSTQVPAADAVAKIGDLVQLRYYRGESTPGNVVGTLVTDACATIKSEGLDCVPAAGKCAGGTGRPVNEVYDQNPPGGTPVAVGGRVTLTHYSENCALGNYVNTAPDAACADLQAKGFGCNPVHVLNPTPNAVVAQDPPAGPSKLGTAVTIKFSPWTPAPSALGTAYPPGTAIPGGRLVYHYTCSAGGGKCRGLDRNEFYSLLAPGSPTVDADFRGEAHAVLMTCGTAPGQRKFWRTWNGGSPRYYQHVASETRPAADDSEELGCVW